MHPYLTLVTKRQRFRLARTAEPGAPMDRQANRSMMSLARTAEHPGAPLNDEPGANRWIARQTDPLSTLAQRIIGNVMVFRAARYS